jgi:hypothetical protein
MTCPRSPPDSLAFLAGENINGEDWVVAGMCAYVPQVRTTPDELHSTTSDSCQVPWLRNASIKENILFHLPYDQDRYDKTLQVR